MLICDGNRWADPNLVLVPGVKNLPQPQDDGENETGGDGENETGGVGGVVVLVERGEEVIEMAVRE